MVCRSCPKNCTSAACYRSLWQMFMDVLIHWKFHVKCSERSCTQFSGKCENSAWVIYEKACLQVRRSLPFPHSHTSEIVQAPHRRKSIVKCDVQEALSLWIRTEAHPNGIQAWHELWGETLLGDFGFRGKILPKVVDYLEKN